MKGELKATIQIGLVSLSHLTSRICPKHHNCLLPYPVPIWRYCINQATTEFRPTLNHDSFSLKAFWKGGLTRHESQSYSISPNNRTASRKDPQRSSTQGNHSTLLAIVLCAKAVEIRLPLDASVKRVPNSEHRSCPFRDERRLQFYELEDDGMLHQVTTTLLCIDPSQLL